MCVPNGPLFQHCQVYDWPPFFRKKYMIDRIFLDWYMKGPTFPMYPVYFVQRFLRLLVYFIFNELTAILV